MSAHIHPAAASVAQATKGNRGRSFIGPRADGLSLRPHPQRFAVLLCVFPVPRNSVDRARDCSFARIRFSNLDFERGRSGSWMSVRRMPFVTVGHNDLHFGRVFCFAFRFRNRHKVLVAPPTEYSHVQPAVRLVRPPPVNGGVGVPTIPIAKCRRMRCRRFSAIRLPSNSWN